HNDSIPEKVSYTLWSGEFVETQGATIAQIFYMLGVEPIRDYFGRVTDIRLIPEEILGRPRIDVVVQTSGQLRDLAASRLFLISRAVEMAANANDKGENFVAKGVLDAEKALVEKGLSPKDARTASTYRVFGGLNGGYGTGITAMVQSGDGWEDKREIAEVYMNNMGAFYGSEIDWENVQKFAFEAALENTDAVVQPRQSNTWGALSLDHVYEFMGGLNLAVKNVTGKEPDAYFSDYRNHNKMRMQELKEAIGVESRTTIFNPEYIREKMKGEASSAAGFAEIVQNIYGWDVMRDEAIDEQLWDEVYNVYVTDKFSLGTQSFFEDKSPAALQEITAVMLEAVRRDMWHASEEQISNLANLHTELLEKHHAACSEMVCNNSRLRHFISSKVDSKRAEKYNNTIRNVRNSAAAGDKSVVMKKETNGQDRQTEMIIDGVVVVAILLVIAVGVVIMVHRRRKNQ
ncbi:MAG: cobaltochelatase subunit CobN, partial [Muribaculaceae bacterium]